ncbi:hypothetical protein ACFL26_02145 [Patescibacteria group bacterium]
MLDQNLVADLKSATESYDVARRKLIGMSDDVRNAAKRSIFAMHREDFEKADALLAEAVAKLADIRQHAEGKPARLLEEGSYRAGLEEYVEARLYRDYLDRGNVGSVEIEGMNVPADVYLGGLSDLVGELQRRQVRAATSGELEEVKRIRDAAEEIVAALLEMDLTGYLRNKLDQAKNGFRRAEDTLYEISIRRK